MHPIAIHVVHRLCMEDTNVMGYQIQKGFILIFRKKIIYLN
jgi:hypothetical protein